MQESSYIENIFIIITQNLFRAMLNDKNNDKNSVAVLINILK